jgi:hypothetical protein
MGWSTAFLDALRAPTVRLRFAVETFDNRNGDGFGVPGIVYSTHPVSGALPWLEYDALAFSAQSVNLDTWAYNRQSWRFSLAPASFRQVAETLRPGTLVRLRVDATLNDYLSAWEIVQSGVVAGVTSDQSGRVTVEVWDILTALKRRITTDVTKIELFPNAGRETTLTANYTAGAGTLTVANILRFDEIAGTSHSDMVLVTPTTGDPFYLEYTGATGSTLTGVAGTGSRGTTAVDAVIGDTVTNVAHVEDRPDQIAGRILTSSAGGANGVLDVYPEEWGYALDSFDTFDYADAIAWGNRYLAPTSGYNIDVISAEPVADGYTWLSGVLQGHALWLANRQGRITVRGARALFSGGVVDTIRGADVLSMRVDWYHKDQRVQYQTVSVFTASGNRAATSTVGGVSSFPCDNIRLYSLQSQVFANEANVGDNLAARVRDWDTAISEQATMTLRSTYWAQYCPGDIIALDIDAPAGRTWGRGRLDSTVDGYGYRRGMITSIAPGWLSGTTQVSIAIAPLSAADDLQ